MTRALALALLLLSPWSLAQDLPPVALKGLDPVALCGGDEIAGEATLTAAHGRFTYRFATPASRATFLGDPDRWSIQWGGACARMGPLSGRGHKDRWTVHAGRIYVFASDSCRAGFLDAPQRHTEKAQAFPSRPPADLVRGRALIERAVEAHGGADAIDRNAALRLGRDAQTQGWNEKRTLTLTRDGGVSRHVVWTPPEKGSNGYDTRWVVGKRSFVVEDGRTIALCSEEIEDVRRIAHREPMAILWARHRDDFKAAHVGRSKLGARVVADVVAHFEGLSTKLHLDPETHRIVGISWRGRASSAVCYDVVETFSKWKKSAGVILPVERVATADGKVRASLSASWDSLELLEAVPAHRPKR